MNNELFYNERLVFDKEEALVTSRFARATSFLRVMPDIFIIGVQKGGTTSLYDNLLQQPQIISSKTKEMFYYGNNSSFGKGKSYYKQFFATKYYKTAKQNKINLPVYSMDASTDTFENLNSPTRILKDNKNAKVILLLRNPAERAFSHYNFSVKKGFELTQFENALKLEEERIGTAENNKFADKNHNYAFYRLGYRSRGIYCDNVANWLKVIPQKNIYINCSEEYFDNPKKIVEEICEFLGIQKAENIIFKKLNEGSHNKINPETFNLLNKFYQPFNEKLFNIIGKKFNW